MNRETNRIKEYQKRLSQSNDPNATPLAIAYRAKRGLAYQTWLSMGAEPKSEASVSRRRKGLILVRGNRA